MRCRATFTVRSRRREASARTRARVTIVVASRKRLGSFGMGVFYQSFVTFKFVVTCTVYLSKVNAHIFLNPSGVSLVAQW